MIDIASPLRLRLDSAALVHNWRWLGAAGEAEAGAAIKADGYGLGARDVLRRLAGAGCRHFFGPTLDVRGGAMPPPAGGLVAGGAASGREARGATGVRSGD